MSGTAYWRDAPETCEACNAAAPEYRIGIKVNQPGASTLPPALRGAVVWSCDAPSCDRALRDRARAACSKHGLAHPTLLTIGPRRSGGMPETPSR